MITSMLLALLLALAVAQQGEGLSYQICDSIAEEYVTAGSRLEGSWPYYNLLYTCSGNLNLEGFPVDACVFNGTKCGQPAADALCQYLGFDYNSVDLYTVKPATAPALSLTGEWCASPNEYREFGHPNRSEFEAITAAYPGPYCAALDSVTCVKTRDSLRRGLDTIRSMAALAPTSAAVLGPAPQQSRTADVLVNPLTFSAGRRMQQTAAS